MEVIFHGAYLNTYKNKIRHIKIKYIIKIGHKLFYINRWLLCLHIAQVYKECIVCFVQLMKQNFKVFFMLKYIHMLQNSTDEEIYVYPINLNFLH